MVPPANARAGPISSPRYDSPKALFHLDPPYHGGEADYGRGMFAPSNFVRMADLLRQLRGAFVLSINETPEIREIFAGFHIDEVRLSYTVAGAAAGSGKARKLIVSKRKERAGLL
ncbi:hypothetical protein EKE94_03065 [Mesobaculum littorinae]|uniref:DNA adenine methylase n=1 Tax=Mesobaculum littorinae TaxID=2486419 RepID=A0A438ALQ0_9RHOB|nr:hypothetical protein [Mesobaculum littorinae]RVV99678.1 hypothetical protein EKE94_03065 [Mesobaculum littorinae]